MSHLGSPFTTEIKWFLSSYRACSDVKVAISSYPADEMVFSRWQVYWAGICSLLKTSIVLLRVDAKACIPGPLSKALTQAWDELLTDKSRYELYWDFIHHERNNILKEYQFSTYARYVDKNGTVNDFPSLLSMVGTKEVLVIGKGPYAGRDGLDLAFEAANWAASYIENAIRTAGLDPDEKVSSDNFLRRQQGLPAMTPSPSGLTLRGILDEGDAMDR